MLSSVCFHCSRCLVHYGEIPDFESMDNAQRQHEVFERAKNVKVCDKKRGGCGQRRVKYRREG